MIKRVLTTTLLCLTAVAWSWTPAMAAVEGYKAIIKSPDSLTVYSTGNSGLSFNNDQEAGGDGEYNPEAAPAPSITMTSGLSGFLLPFTFDTVDVTSPLKVVVVTTSLLKPGTNNQTELLNQGPNVEGLRYRLKGTKLVGATPVTLTMEFTLTASPQGNGTTSFTRNWVVRAANGTALASGKYHIFNPNSVSPIPEPGSLALLASGAMVGVLVLRARRKKPELMKRS